jgi:hypothetical protein
MVKSAYILFYKFCLLFYAVVSLWGFYRRSEKTPVFSEWLQMYLNGWVIVGVQFFKGIHYALCPKQGNYQGMILLKMT